MSSSSASSSASQASQATGDGDEVMEMFATSCSIKKKLREKNTSLDIHHCKTVYEVALENFDHRLMPKKIQLCGALLDPYLANNIELSNEITRQFRFTSRTDVLIEYVNKYKLADVDVEGDVGEDNTAAPARPDATRQPQGAVQKLSSRQGLLGQFPPAQQLMAAPQVRRSLESEVQEYFEMAKTSDLECEVLNWWGKNEGQFPTIAKLARLVLAIPATSAAAESAFSISSCVVTAKRSRISPFKASQILFVHDNYELLKKFNLAGN